MITWTRNPSGAFERGGELSDAREVFIEMLKDDGDWRRSIQRYCRGDAVTLIETSISAGLVRYGAYRVVAAPPRLISEATRARLAALHARDIGENEMAKKKQKQQRKPSVKRTSQAPKAEGDGRKPALAEFINAPMEIFGDYKGKRFEARVSISGIITYEGEQFTSPSLAAAKARNTRTCNGWTFWKFIDAKGEEVFIDVLRKKAA